MVVITVNTATLDDFLYCPETSDLFENGCSALMSVRSCGRDNFYKTCLTLGSGEKGEAPFNSLEAFKADDIIASKYKYLTMNNCENGNIVNLSINRLKEINSDTLYNARPGKLGQLLRTSGIKTAFIGGFWNENSIKSPAFFISMDSSGLTDMGETEGVFTGESIDEKKILTSIDRFINDSGFMVIELGDIESLYINRKSFSEDAYLYNKRQIMGKTGSIIESIKNMIDFKNTVLVVMSSFSSDFSNEDAETLSPFVIYDGGLTKGILKSESTRREGIISAQDFAPLVLNYFGLNSGGFQGRPMKKSSITGLNYLKQLNEKTYNVSISRAPVLKVYAICIMIVLAIYLLRAVKPVVYTFLIKFILVIPLIFLCAGAFNITGISHMIVYIILSCLVVSAIMSSIFKSSLNYIAAVSFFIILLISIDIISGQSLLKFSVFSYDPIIGARFYGIGNEFLGAMGGCSLILCGYIIEKKAEYKKIAVCLLILISLIVGLPMFGANAGGLISLAAGFMIFISLEYNRDLKASLKAGSAASVLSLLLLAGVNIVFKGSESHLGRMLYMASYEGVPYIFNIILRKVNMEVRLIRYTIWSIVLIALIIASVINAYRPGNYAKKMFEIYPHYKNVFIAGSISCIAALIFNDSGIVTAAVIMLYMVFSGILLYDENV